MNCKAFGHDCSYEPVSQDAKEAGRERHDRSKRRKTGSHNGSIDPEEGPSDQDGDQGACGLTGRTRRQASSAEVQRDEDAGGDDDNSAPSASIRVETSTPKPAFRSVRAPGTSVARILVSANGVSSYHGRTSALFEDNPDRPAAGDARPRMPDDWVERGLVAEAARQRTHISICCDDSC